MIQRLFSAAAARALDQKASASWGLDPFALVEAAGRGCARAFTGNFSIPRPCRIAVAAGSGNNGADAMVMLRALIFGGFLSPSASALIVNRLSPGGERSPRSQALEALKAMGVPVFVWNDGAEALASADIVIDGIAGTGLRGALSGAALEMVRAVDDRREQDRRRPLIVSVDIPSGNSDAWEPGMPVLRADMTLAIEPLKAALYVPAVRPCAGTIVPVGEIFPSALIDSMVGEGAAAGAPVSAGYPELLDWETARDAVPPVLPEAYKYSRGLVEIRAGSMGSAGAARIAARGAQAAGAGLVRLLVDEALYPVLAPSAGGIMIAAAGSEGAAEGRFVPDAMLLGPGWGRGPERLPVLEKALLREEEGMPLILDADAIALARDRVFHGNVILTPHPGELAAYAGLPREEALARPGPVLLELARRKRALILFKSHVLIIAAADGRLGFIDGMVPALGTGGTGDLLAGICAALAARMKRAGTYDGYACAAAAAALLIKSAQHADIFIDPLELGDTVAGLAGAAWLCRGL